MKQLLLLFLAISIAGCDARTQFSRTDKDFKDNRWQKSDVKVYNFELTEKATPYRFDVFFSHVYDYQFADVPLMAEVTYPNGDIKHFEFPLFLKDENGKELGDCSGDYCDLTQPIPIPEATGFQTGKYKIRLMHNFNGEYLPNVLAVGIRVERLSH